MAKKSTPESNNVLIVALVFFVLTTLTLGVFTYLGYDGQKQYADDAKKEKTAAQNAAKALNEEKVKRLVLAIATGNDQTNDQSELARLKSNAEPAFTAATAGLKGIKWNPTQAKPEETYSELIEKLRKEKEIAVNERAGFKKELDKAKEDFDATLKSASDRSAAAEKNLKSEQDKALEDLQKVRDYYLTQIAKIDQDSKNLEAEKRLRADDVSAAEREKKKLFEKIDGLNKQILERDAKIAPPDSIEVDSPKGQILRVDRQAGVVFINLGQADYLRPKVTFSVFSPNAGAKTTEKRQRKGTIEVVSVLESHLATARITDVVDEYRDPILAGDLIFNPSWTSAGRQHIALAGIFDLDADGTDDTAELVRNLERQGIVVDAWLDLKSRTIKGPGITEGTSFLVLGERPQLNEAMSRMSATHPDHPIVQGNLQINSKIADMENTSKEKGVQKVAYVRYLTLVGYKLPKATKPLDATLSSYVRGAAAAPPSSESGTSTPDKPK